MLLAWNLAKFRAIDLQRPFNLSLAICLAIRETWPPPPMHLVEQKVHGGN